MFWKVVQVMPTNDYKVYVYFDDGNISGNYDPSNFLDIDPDNIYDVQ